MGTQSASWCHRAGRGQPGSTRPSLCPARTGLSRSLRKPSGSWVAEGTHSRGEAAPVSSALCLRTPSPVGPERGVAPSKPSFSLSLRLGGPSPGGGAALGSLASGGCCDGDNRLAFVRVRGFPRPQELWARRWGSHATCVPSVGSVCCSAREGHGLLPGFRGVPRVLATPNSGEGVLASGTLGWTAEWGQGLGKGTNRPGSASRHARDGKLCSVGPADAGRLGRGGGHHLCPGLGSPASALPASGAA